MLSTQEVRFDIPILKNLIYMDCAATSPIPRPVFEAMSNYWNECPFNYGQSHASFRGSKETKRRCDEARKNVAELINSKPEEVVFTKNTTEAINIVAHGLDFGRDDEVLISNIEHQSNHIPWLCIGKQKNIKVKVIRANQEGRIPPEKIEEMISPRTRLISITHASNVFGSIQDVKTIGRIAQNYGVTFLIDSAQTAGRIPIDVKEIDCDFMAICGRKSLMGPQGTGALYGREDVLQNLNPHEIGGVAAILEDDNEYRLAELPDRLHAGMYNAMGIVGLGRAVKYVGKDIGIGRVRAHIEELTCYLIDRLEQIDSVLLYGPKKLVQQNGVISFNLAGTDSRDMAWRLDNLANIAVGSGSHGSPGAMHQIKASGTVRVSLQFYNTKEEIDRLLSAIDQIRAEQKLI